MAKSIRRTRKRLGQILLDEGVVGVEQLERAIESQHRTGDLLVDSLTKQGEVSGEALAGAVAGQMGTPYLSVGQYHIAKEALALFPEEICRQYRFMPLDIIGHTVTIAAGNLLNADIISELERITRKTVRLFIGRPAEVKVAIEEHYGKSEAASTDLSSLGSLLLDGLDEAFSGIEDTGG